MAAVASSDVPSGVPGLAPQAEAAEGAERQHDEGDTPDQAELIMPMGEPKFHTPEAAAESELATEPIVTPPTVITADESAIGGSAPAKRSRPRRKKPAEAASSAKTIEIKSGEPPKAGLDVYEWEPELSPGLIELENVVLLPHVGSGTIETRTRMGVMAAKNLLTALRGERPLVPARDPGRKDSPSPAERV